MDIFATQEVVNTFSNPLSVTYLLGMGSIFGFIIAWTYNKTKSTTENKYELENTIIIMTVITTLIIMVIGNSIARAIGIFGAFSIIRFRTPMKNPRDTAFVFLSLAAGLAAGTGTIIVGFIGVLFICLLALFLDYSHLLGLRQRDYIVTFCVGKKYYSDKSFKQVMERYINSDMNLNINPIADQEGKCVHFNFSIAIKQKGLLNNFVKELSSFDGVSNINITKPVSDIK